MKKIILTALNTRHTHSALALAYLKSYWEKTSGRPQADIIEFDLNQTNEAIITALILQNPDYVAFSAYIWSIERILVIANAIKSAKPDTTIILGGPEVSYNAVQILMQNVALDFIVRGEGEVTFSELLSALQKEEDVSKINGITYRDSLEIIENPPRPLLADLDEIPSPFQNNAYKNIHKFTYYEASRGCPSNCTYCLSSVLGDVRNHSIERIKSDLNYFFESDYQQIRFADRTFNYDSKRAMQILEYIRKNNHKKINFHFEIQAEFLTEEVMEFFASVKEEMFHLEIGIQSTNPRALKAVNRRFNLDVLREKISVLKDRTLCHLHLDLLGALPCDTFEDFKQSLNDVWKLNPDDIQISLVKVLRGTPLQQQAAQGDIYCMDFPPYTVYRTKWLAAEDAVKIQDIGKLVEGIANSGRFSTGIQYMIRHFFAESAADFFSALADYWRTNELQFYSFSPERTAKHLDEFCDIACSDPEKKIDAKHKAAVSSILTHELRLSQKVPTGDPGPQPDFSSRVARHLFRPSPGIKAFWYDYHPLRVFSEGLYESQGPCPVVYNYQPDLSLKPHTETLAISFAEGFVITAIQLRASIDTFSMVWKQHFSSKPTPDFEQVLEKLCQKGLIYNAEQKRALSTNSAKKREI